MDHSKIDKVTIWLVNRSQTEVNMILNIRENEMEKYFDGKFIYKTVHVHNLL